MKKERGKVSNLVLKASILYLGLHVLDSLCFTVWGGFLILATIATLGCSFVVGAVAYLLFGCDYNVGAVLIISAIFGSLTALRTCSKIYGKRIGRRKRRTA